MSESRIPDSRARQGWWLLVAALALVLAFTAYSLLGTFVLGLFFYYGMRPIDRRIERYVDSPGVAALLTMVLTALPFFLVTGYLVVEALQEVLPRLDQYSRLLRPYVDTEGLLRRPVETIADVLRNPQQYSLQGLLPLLSRYLGMLVDALTTLLIAILFAFYLLRDDDRLHRWFRGLLNGGEDSAAYAYATAVDRDLETVYFSNVLLVMVIAVLSQIVYHGYNFLAPAVVDIPLPTVLALLTGLASLIPLVVGKVVYVPLVGYLAWLASAAAEPGLLLYPLALLGVCFVALDFVPLTFVLPELAGRSTHVGAVMFGYIVGTTVFGWYGLFLGPLVVVLVIQVVRIALRELLYGERVTPAVRSAPGLGSDPDRDPDGAGGEE